MLKTLRRFGLATTGMFMIMAAAANAWSACNICDCHMNHANCWFYDHEDVCNSAPGKENCYFHPDENCPDNATPEPN